VNQVVIVEIPLADSIKSLGLFVNGTRVIGGHNLNQEHQIPIRSAAEMLADALGVSLKTIEVNLNNYSDQWDWREIGLDLINNDNLVPPRGSSELMRGFYRCPRCFTQWDVVDETNAAQNCIQCEETAIEPFCSAEAHASGDDPMVIRALAEHERKHPSVAEAGNYCVSVTRECPATKTITVENAIGPASAQMEALWQAPDMEWQSGPESFYEITGYSRQQAD
jgi:hypothetical protein